MSEFDVKLMNIDNENLGIPDTEYQAQVTMSSGITLPKKALMK